MRLPILTACLFFFSLSAGAAEPPAHAWGDLKAINDARLLTERLANLTWPFEAASSSPAVRGVLGLGGQIGLEFDRASHPGKADLRPLPEFGKLDKHGYRDAALAAARNLKIFLNYSAGFPKDSVKRVAAAARRLLPLLKAEALRLSVADPQSLYAQRLEEIDGQLRDGEEDGREIDLLFAVGELQLALDSYKKDKGAFPDKLERLVPGYLPELPLWNNRDHKGSAAALNYAGRAGKPRDAVTDAGGWLYFSEPASPHFGRVLPNCAHKTRSGRPVSEIAEPERPARKKGGNAAPPRPSKTSTP